LLDSIKPFIAEFELDSMDFFPYDVIRPEQDKLLADIKEAIKAKKNIIAHAPTGLGKTSAALAPAIEYAVKNNLTVFFLTSRNTQHTLVIETLREINKKQNVLAVDFIGKKGMCPQMKNYDPRTINFAEFCKNQKKNGDCKPYKNTCEKADYTKKADIFVEELIKKGPLNVEEVVDLCSDQFCAYEIAMRLAQHATVIVADYYHLFSPKVRKIFLTKIKKDIKKSIVIVDEAHNLPDRVRNLLTSKLNTIAVLKLADTIDSHGAALRNIAEQLSYFVKTLKGAKELKVEKKDFVALVEESAECRYSQFIETLKKTSEEVEDPDDSDDLTKFIYFLENWNGGDEEFVRVLKSEKTRGGRPFASLEYSCLHPGTLSGGLLGTVYSAILMSGTLVPTEMYRDVLGLNKDTILKIYPNPFPSLNRHIMISPTITTKYEERNEAMFKKIAVACAQLINTVKGNSAVFFSSYNILSQTIMYLNGICDKKLFVETRGMTKEERGNLISDFKQNLVAGGGAIIGVQGANFSEGIDLPGDLLKAVAIVGVPFAPPGLRQKAVIDYYEQKFGKGWDYGYIFPAMNKALQAAGRCIRSETDRGVIAFLDKRFAWSKYASVIPPDWNIDITNNFREKVEKFFSK